MKVTPVSSANNTFVTSIWFILEKGIRHVMTVGASVETVL